MFRVVVGGSDHLPGAWSVLAEKNGHVGAMDEPKRVALARILSPSGARKHGQPSQLQNVFDGKVLRLPKDPKRFKLRGLVLPLMHHTDFSPREEVGALEGVATYLEYLQDLGPKVHLGTSR